MGSKKRNGGMEKMLTDLNFTEIKVYLGILKRRKEESVLELKKLHQSLNNLDDIEDNKFLMDSELQHIEKLESLIDKIEARLFPHMREEAGI